MLMHQLLVDGAMRSPDKIAFRWVDRQRTPSFRLPPAFPMTPTGKIAKADLAAWLAGAP